MGKLTRSILPPGDLNKLLDIANFLGLFGTEQVQALINWHNRGSRILAMANRNLEVKYFVAGCNEGGCYWFRTVQFTLPRLVHFISVASEELCYSHHSIINVENIAVVSISLSNSSFIFSAVLFVLVNSQVSMYHFVAIGSFVSQPTLDLSLLLYADMFIIRSPVSFAAQVLRNVGRPSFLDLICSLTGCERFYHNQI
jgi:hypothetical protein